jgi:5-methylcytosine-specific restriction endonuclease McrA
MPKKLCKICGKKADSDYCFQHKARKRIPTNTSRDVLILEEMPSMRDFFISIWKKREHRCENCNTYLGTEPLSYMFDHVLEKSKYPDLKYEEENICILCLNCHSNKTNCKLSDFMKEKIKKVKERFQV